MRVEFDAIVNIDTCSLCDFLSSKSSIGTKGLYKLKCTLYGSIEKYKARLGAESYAKKKALILMKLLHPLVV